MAATELISAAILIATDDVTDAEMVRKNLAEEFKNVFVSTNPDLIAQISSAATPTCWCCLATLEKAERYYRVISPVPGGSAAPPLHRDPVQQG